MGENYCYIEDSVLRQYIKDNFVIENFSIGSDYELVCALLMKILFEELHNTPCLIGFKTKKTYGLPIHAPITDHKICKNFLERYLDKDTPVDFCVSPVLSFNQKRNKIFAWTFQAKRFGKFQDAKDTNGLIDYLIKIKNKYARTNSILVIFFDGHKGLNLRAVCNDERLKDFPFEAIFFIEINEDKDAYWRVNMGQLWPVYGYNAYDATKAVRDGILANVSFKYKDTVNS